VSPAATSASVMPSMTRRRSCSRQASVGSWSSSAPAVAATFSASSANRLDDPELPDLIAELVGGGAGHVDAQRQ
jgi:hypothetical protein